MSVLQDHDSLRSRNFATIVDCKAVGFFFFFFFAISGLQGGRHRRDIFARSAWASQAHLLPWQRDVTTSPTYLSASRLFLVAENTVSSW